MTTKKIVNDYIKYLKHIEESSRKLDTLQKNQLNSILQAQLTLLVALKKSSGLGKTFLKFRDSEIQYE